MADEIVTYIYNVWRSILLWMLPLCLLACHDDAIGEIGGSDTSPGQDAHEVWMTIPIFCNSEEQQVFEPVVRMALDNISRAQQDKPHKVWLSPAWYDSEAEERQGMLDLAMERALMDTATCAILAPPESRWAERLICIAQNLHRVADCAVPILLHSTTSLELHRRYATDPYVCFLCESDMAQSEMYLAYAERNGFRKVHFISTDDIYGITFHDKVPFMCVEWGMTLGQNQTIPAEEMTAERMVEAFGQCGTRLGDDEMVVLASCNLQHYLLADSLLDVGRLDMLQPTQLLYTDAACYYSVQGRLRNARGMALSSPHSVAFNDSCAMLDGVRAVKVPIYNQSQVYDAILMAYLSAYVQQVRGCTAEEALLGLTTAGVQCRQTRALRRSMANDCAWHAEGIRAAIDLIYKGGWPYMDGATGSWDYDGDCSSERLYSTYCVWETQQGVTCIPDDAYYHTQLYSRRSDKEGRTDEWTALHPDSGALSTVIPDAKNYFAESDCWAVLVAASAGWKNYRHQADVLAMYHTLLSHGYDDDHILLIINDDLAYDERNAYPGEVYNVSGGDNLYAGIDVDIRTSEVKDVQMFTDLCTGAVVPPLKSSFCPKPTDNVLLYWAGHGNEQNSLLWLDKFTLSPAEMAQWVEKFQYQGGFNKMFMVYEACYSGGLAVSLKVPGLFVMTAAGEREASFASGMSPDSRLNTYLADDFSKRFTDIVAQQPSISLCDLYKRLYLSVCNSHVTISDPMYYGSLYKFCMTDFMTE